MSVLWQVRLMGAVYLLTLLAHLLLRKHRPAGWHNALRQSALSLELLFYALKLLLDEGWSAATGVSLTNEVVANTIHHSFLTPRCSFLTRRVSHQGADGFALVARLLAAAARRVRGGDELLGDDPR